MSLAVFEVGQKVLWHREMRGGWGYIQVIRGTVVGLHRKLISIEVTKVSGEKKVVRVNPTKLRALTPTPTERK